MNRLFIYLLSGFFASLLLYVLLQGLPDKLELTDPKISLTEAEQFYRNGETAKTVSERKEAFNHSLAIYLDLEKRYHPDYGNGKLYYNIGNSYYQLGEIPLAIYYYYRALYLAPRDVETEGNLAQALKKLNLTKKTSALVSGHNLTLASIFSLPMRLTLFFYSIVGLFCLASLFIWKRLAWLKLLIGLLGVLALFLLCTLLYTRFISPQEGVLIRSSSLFREAGTQYAKVLNEPLPGGLKVEVIAIRENGTWIKILSPDGSLGYVSSDAIKLL